MKNFMKITMGLIWIMSSCEEVVDFDWADQEPKLVVDGIITNEPFGNYIRLTLSDSLTPGYDDYGGDWYRIAEVNNALVIVSDDMGNTDTLTPSSYYHTLYKDDSYIVTDSVLITTGTYRVTKLQGVPGHKYHLYIKYENHEYNATAYMNEVPEIDTIYFGKVYNPVKYEYYYPPLISFPILQHSENNYLFLFYYSFGDYPIEDTQITYEGSTFDLDMTLLPGEFLDSYVNGLDVLQGYSGDYWKNGYSWLEPDQTVSIAMYSITPEGYRFYNSLTKQIERYDGIFNPAPTTPVGNISGGAFGYFGASAVSRISGYLPAEN